MAGIGDKSLKINEPKGKLQLAWTRQHAVGVAAKEETLPMAQ